MKYASHFRFGKNKSIAFYGEFHFNLLVFEGRMERMLRNSISVLELCMLNIAHSLKFMHAHPPKKLVSQHTSQHSCSQKCYGTKKGPSSNVCSACECWDKDTFSPNLIFWQRNAVFSLLLVERWWYFPRQLSDRILFHRNEIENVSHISNSIVSIVFRGRKFHFSKKVDVRWSFLWWFDHHEKCFVKAIIHVSVRFTNQTHVSGYMIVWWSIKQNITQCHVKITE